MYVCIHFCRHIIIWAIRRHCFSCSCVDWLVLAKVPWYSKRYLWGYKQGILLQQPAFELMYKSPQKYKLFECDACERLPHTLHKRSLGTDDKDLEVVCSFYPPHWSRLQDQEWKHTKQFDIWIVLNLGREIKLYLFVGNSWSPEEFVPATSNWIKSNAHFQLNSI